MKKLKKIWCLLMTIVIFCCSNRFAFAEELINYDSFLSSKGVPLEIIDSLTEEQKQLIFQTIAEDAEFEGYDIQTFTSENNDVMNEGVQVASGIIPDSEMTISVIGFSATYNGQACYIIYPSFVWNSISRISNDSFAMALYDGWEAIPGYNNLEVYLRNSQGNTVQHTSVAAAVSASSGYNYVIPGSIGSVQALYEGHAYLYAKKTNSSATHAISLNYIDDTSSSMNVSYGVNIGYASISISQTDSRLRFKSGNFNF